LLVRNINKALESPLHVDVLAKSIAQWWPQLEEHLRAIPPKPTAAKLTRTTESMVEELLSAVREQTKNIAEILARIALASAGRDLRLEDAGLRALADVRTYPGSLFETATKPRDIGPPAHDIGPPKT
jgi:hypothetical protein